MNFTSAMRLTITLFVLLTIGTVGIVAYAAGGSNERAAAATYIDHILYTCEVEDIAEELPGGAMSAGIGADLAAMLIDAGWQGFAGDGAERIYSPACVVHVDEHDNVIVKDVDGNIVR